MKSLNQKTIWLTGASSGIGEALAFELARRGARLAISARRVDVLNKIADQIKASGHEAHVFACDVCDIDQTKHTKQEITQKLGPIDILIANAGTHLFTIPEEFNSKEYLEIMRLNYGGILHCIEAVLPEMIANRDGHIVGTASLAGYRGLPRAAAYSASKAAAINFLDSLRFHLKQYKIPVTVVNPGFVKTPLTDKNDFYMPFLISAEKSAKIICDGIEKEKREIAFPFPFNLILKFAKLIPYGPYEFIVDKLWVR